MEEEKSGIAKESRLSEDAPDNARQPDDAQQQGLEKATRQRREQQSNEAEDKEEKNDEQADEQTPGRMVSPEESGREHEGGV